MGENETKTCKCCGTEHNRASWETLPAAPGGLRALGFEWRNCECGSTLAIQVEDFDDEN
jgi:hypothetical protein